jgi:hypothetical protein
VENHVRWKISRLIGGIMRAEFSVLRRCMQSIEHLTQEILSLLSASRALLAEKLVESLEFDTDPTILMQF